MKEDGRAEKAQIIYFSHGGGPLPVLGDTGHRAMIDFMRRLPAQLQKPDSILVVSAHWEEGVATLLGSRNPPILHDYYGFPKEAYDITYPAPGSPALAEKIGELLRENNVRFRIDTERGFDHGLFIPLKLMYPQADIPSLQISLLSGLDAGAHLALGKALARLRGENILVIGSGFSFHNLQAFSWAGSDERYLSSGSMPVLLSSGGLKNAPESATGSRTSLPLLSRNSTSSPSIVCPTRKAAVENSLAMPGFTRGSYPRYDGTAP